MKYTFVSYYKYCFSLTLENGKTISNREQNGDDIYRLDIGATGDAEPQDDGTYLVDGYTFE